MPEAGARSNMAKVEFQSGMWVLHGKLGNMLFRRCPSGISVGPLPDPPKREATPFQQAGRLKFKQVTVLTHERLKDPVWKADTERLAKERHLPLWNTAISRVWKELGKTV